LVTTLSTTPTKEERAIADAQVEGAAAALAVLERRLEKTVLRAPADGVVSVIVVEVGENLTAGQPVLAIAAAGKQWLSFNAREDLLHGLTVGAKDVARPGAHASTPAIVTELVPLGPFATWQAERAVGDHDRNTLRLRLDLQRDAAAFEPGMTVWFSVALGGMWFCQLGCCGRTRAQSEFISEAHRLSKHDA
jgi:HlyD family secretion protein